MHKLKKEGGMLLKTNQNRKKTSAKKKGDFLPYLWKHKYLYLMLVPALVYYIIFCYVPMYGEIGRAHV